MKLTNLCVLFLLFSLVAHAQDSGSLRGQVLDENGLVLPGAIITITDLDKKAVTDENGSFRMAAIPVGTHRLNVSYLGFEPQGKHWVRIARRP